MPPESGSGHPATDVMFHRRGLLRVGLGGIVTGLAGCAGGNRATGQGAEADVIVGPNQELRFEPERVTVEPNEEVTWYFASDTHNVSGVPAHHERVDIPAAADPFASYEGDDPLATEPAGTTYRHTFAEPGRFVYVCVPHAQLGMVAEVVVEA